MLIHGQHTISLEIPLMICTLPCSAAENDAERAAAAMIHNQYLDIHRDIHNDPLSMSGTSDPSGSDIECPGTNHGGDTSALISDSD